MKTYTAANDSEARSLHDGTQTLIVVPMEPQPCEKSIAELIAASCSQVSVSVKPARAGQNESSSHRVWKSLLITSFSHSITVLLSPSINNSCASIWL